MDQPLNTRIAHRRGDHDYEAEYHATRGCTDCYRLVGHELERDPAYELTADQIDAIEGAAEERDYQHSLGPKWLGTTKDFTSFIEPGGYN